MTINTATRALRDLLKEGQRLLKIRRCVPKALSSALNEQRLARRFVLESIRLRYRRTDLIGRN